MMQPSDELSSRLSISAEIFCLIMLHKAEGKNLNNILLRP